MEALKKFGIGNIFALGAVFGFCIYNIKLIYANKSKAPTFIPYSYTKMCDPLDKKFASEIAKLYEKAETKY